jgi:hypothetical protein
LPVTVHTFQDEVGELYVRRTVGFESERMKRDDKEEFRRVFREETRAKEPRPIPVVVADELTCASM